MTEFDIYLPANKESGEAIATAQIDAIKEELVGAFGGYTDLKHRCEGAWKLGGILFRDSVNIVRVLDDGTAHFDMKAFKAHLEEILGQKSVLIVSREVCVL